MNILYMYCIQACLFKCRYAHPSKCQHGSQSSWNRLQHTELKQNPLATICSLDTIESYRAARWRNRLKNLKSREYIWASGGASPGFRYLSFSRLRRTGSCTSFTWLRRLWQCWNACGASPAAVGSEGKLALSRALFILWTNGTMLGCLWRITICCRIKGIIMWTNGTVLGCLWITSCWRLKRQAGIIMWTNSTVWPASKCLWHSGGYFPPFCVKRKALGLIGEGANWGIPDWTSSIAQPRTWISWQLTWQWNQNASLIFFFW